jgi:hypothetical protein
MLGPRVDRLGEARGVETQRLHELAGQNFAGMGVVQPLRINGSP